MILEAKNGLSVKLAGVEVLAIIPDFKRTGKSNLDRKLCGLNVCLSYRPEDLSNYFEKYMLESILREGEAETFILSYGDFRVPVDIHGGNYWSEESHFDTGCYFGYVSSAMFDCLEG